MPTIKGKVTIGNGKPLPKEVTDVIALPFQANGWKSTVNSELVKEDVAHKSSVKKESKEAPQVAEKVVEKAAEKVVAQKVTKKSIKK